MLLYFEDVSEPNYVTINNAQPPHSEYSCRVYNFSKEYTEYLSSNAHRIYREHLSSNYYTRKTSNVLRCEKRLQSIFSIHYSSFVALDYTVKPNLQGS